MSQICDFGSIRFFNMSLLVEHLLVRMYPEWVTNNMEHLLVHEPSDRRWASWRFSWLCCKSCLVKSWKVVFLKQRHHHQHHDQRFIKLINVSSNYIINGSSNSSIVINHWCLKNLVFQKIITVLAPPKISLPFPTRRALSHTGLKRLAIGLETALLMDSPKARCAARWSGEWMKSWNFWREWLYIRMRWRCIYSLNCSQNCSSNCSQRGVEFFFGKSAVK